MADKVSDDRVYEYLCREKEVRQWVQDVLNIPLKSGTLIPHLKNTHCICDKSKFWPWNQAMLLPALWKFNFSSFLSCRFTPTSKWDCIMLFNESGSYCVCVCVCVWWGLIKYLWLHGLSPLLVSQLVTYLLFTDWPRLDSRHPRTD